jgi:hypothetical protein
MPDLDPVFQQLARLRRALDEITLEQITEWLPTAFYSLMGLALLLALLGAAGPALLLLLLGALVHVARVGAEAATATRRAPARR